VKPETEAAARPGLDAVHAARQRLSGVIWRTPLERSAWLSDAAGIDVHLKLECWQRTRSFKIRGAYSAISALDDDTCRKGIVAASAGNHGLAVAVAAGLRGARATIFVPGDAPSTKRDRIRGHGADLRTVSGTYDHAARAARSFAAETGAHLVHAFADPAVVAGQGTIALEITEDLPDVRSVVVPVGGGGLVSGVGLAMKAVAGPAVRVIGVQSTATTAMHAAFEAGRVVPVEDQPTLCDGLAGETEPVAYELARSVVDVMDLVPEERIGNAIRELHRREGIVAEGAGVVGVAAILAGVLEPEGPAVVVVSGGNIDSDRLARILAGD
jgi:threonine dehydratase